MCELPVELTARPLALIGLTGLDLTNPTHRSIWEAFSNNRKSDGTFVQFKLLNLTHEFPTVKPKRNSYEWYIPKGILKRSWMNKYLNEIPSVVVVFYELDWKDPMWNEQKIECASTVQSLRAALEGRSTKIAVVLIQKNPPAPPGSEDVIATERATALCGACELPAKMLYILPQGDHLLGYTSRLETAFYDLAIGFYHHEYRVVKGHRDQLNKTIHQYLFVRHQFKMGFFNELKQDHATAQRHFMQAYNNLLDIRMVDTNALEIKTVASFINYKLCKISFNLHCPKDAISQFRLHIDRFKLKTGPKELLFEHHAWMSSQFSTFAELFDDAIRQGLPAVQTQHPGYYFQLSAHHASLRQTACKELCKNVDSYPDPDPLTSEEKLEFYGQRPWRPGKLSAEPADTMREAAAIQALQYREKTTVNHSMIIIGLLGNAISQFKIYRCPRMRRSLVVQMAEEYYNCKDYGKVLTLLMHMLWEYHGERWPVLLTDILKNALRAAYLSTSIQDYLALAVEALRPTTTFTDDRRSCIYRNILNILQKKPPNPEPDLPDDEQNTAMNKWAAELNRSEPAIFTIDDSNMTSFIDVKARFSQPKYTVNSTVTICVFVRNSYCGTVEFSKVLISVVSPGYSMEYTIAKAPQDNLVFNAQETKEFLCQFPAPRQGDNSEIRIGTVSLHMGNDTICSVVLRFSLMGKEANLLDRLYPEIQQLRNEKFDVVRPLTSAEIKQEDTSLNISVNCQGPALLGEWFPIGIAISTIENIVSSTLHVSLIPDGSNEQSTELSLTMTAKQMAISVAIGTLEKGHSTEQTVFMRSHKSGERNLIVKVDYCKSERIPGTRELIYPILVMKPFEVTTQFYTTLFEPLTKGFLNESFIMMPHISCVSPWPIEIISTLVELGDSVKRENEDNQSGILAGCVLKEEETATDIYSLIPTAGSDQPISIGIYTIKWRRANVENALETSSSVTLAPLWVENAVIGLRAKLPPHGWVRMPFCVSYYIRNHSDYVITLRLTMEASDAFMFAGQKQVDIYILPKNERKIEWILRPLVAGFVALPSLSLTVPSDEEYKVNKARLTEVLERSLPTHVYILDLETSRARLRTFMSFTPTEQELHVLATAYRRILRGEIVHSKDIKGLSLCRDGQD